MRKINLRGISEILSEKELKNVMGGSNFTCSISPCSGSCTVDGVTGRCGMTQGVGCTCATIIVG